MKMRVLFATGKGKMKNVAQFITDNYATEKVNCMDSIPPAYACDKERLVVMVVSTGKDPATPVIRFCKELTKLRTANVAFILDGSEEGLKILMDAVKEAGSHVIDKVLPVKCGLFGSKLSDEEKKTVTDWMNEVTAAMV